MDARSLYNPTRVLDLTTVGYSAVVTPSFFVEGRFSARNETLEQVGATSTGLVDGTLQLQVIDEDP